MKLRRPSTLAAILLLSGVTVVLGAFSIAMLVDIFVAVFGVSNRGAEGDVTVLLILFVTFYFGRWTLEAWSAWRKSRA